MDTFVTKAARLNGPRDIELIERELVCGEDDIIVTETGSRMIGGDKRIPITVDELEAVVGR